jgi:hypothetical protein
MTDDSNPAWSHDLGLATSGSETIGAEGMDEVSFLPPSMPEASMDLARIDAHQ